MMRRAAVLAPLILAWPMASPGQDPPAPKPVVPVAVIDAPKFVTAGNRLVLLQTGTISKIPAQWTIVYPKGTPAEREGKALIVKEVVPGISYRFALTAVGDPNPETPGFPFIATDYVDVPILPTPQPPKPVDPVNPVDPVPVPAPVPPGPIGNMRAVVLYESSANMTANQYNAMFSTVGIRPYLKAKTLKDSDGGNGYRVWDKDVDVSNESSEWQDAMAKAKADPKPLPKIVLFSGMTPVDSRTVVDETDAMTWLRSKGGN